MDVQGIFSAVVALLPHLQKQRMAENILCHTAKFLIDSIHLPLPVKPANVLSYSHLLLYASRPGMQEEICWEFIKIWIQTGGGPKGPSPLTTEFAKLTQPLQALQPHR